jgi:hypothetical protein
MKNNISIKKKYLKTLYESCNAIVNECLVIVSNEGWNIKPVDPAYVSMAEIIIPIGQFEEYYCSLDKDKIGYERDLSPVYRDLIQHLDIVVGCPMECPYNDVKPDETLNGFVIELENLKSILKKGNDNDLIRMSIDDDLTKQSYGYPIDKKGTYGTVTFRNQEKNGMSIPKIPRINGFLCNDIMIESDKLLSSLMAVNEYSDFCALQNNGTFNIEAINDKSDFKVMFKNEELIKFSSNLARSLFPLDYLTKIIKGLKSIDIIALDIGTDIPLRVRANTDKMSIVYLLAPRIEND